MKRYLLPAILLAASFASAQEFRATVTGRVTDPSGAVIPKARVTVTNTDTGVKVTTVTTSAGEYTAPFLLPGMYQISVVAPTFETYRHDGIKIQSGERVGEDVQMTVGSESQEVHVTANSSLIETQTATAGQVLTQEEIENLPSNGRSPIGLAKTEYGVVPKSKNSVVQERPFDNSASSDFSIGGGNSQSNEILLNGVPDMQDSSRVSGYSPSQDSVQEVRVDVFEADASNGDTSGGTVNMITKAGLNTYHGTAFEFNQFSAINAPARWFIPVGQLTPATRQNQYGGTIGGPVRIPHVFNGTDKLFFFYSYERFKDTVPDAQINTVPTVAERTGDFSALLPLGCATGTYDPTNPGVCIGGKTNAYQLYDPATGVVSGSSVKRSPFAGNIIPSNRISPVAKGYLQFYPLPNVPGVADGENNYFSNHPTADDYNSHAGRLDLSINTFNKIFFEVHRSEYKRTQSNIFQNIASGTRTYNVYQGGVLDYIHTFSPTLTMDGRLGLSRSYLNSTLPSQGFDATSIGFPSYINTNAIERFLPRLVFSESSGTKAFAGLSTTPGALSAFDTIQFFAALTKVKGHHVLKIGPDIRQEKYTKLTPGAASGSFSFANTYVTSNTATATNPFGGSFASFLLGLPTSGTQAIGSPAQYNNWYSAGFFQDDWRALPSLTLNMGLRLEHETPIVESRNKAVVGFDPTLTNAATGPATAAYALSPIPELPVGQFQATGGVIYASPSHRNEYNTAPVYISPRFGFAFSPEMFKGKTAIRGGFGLFVNPFNDYNTPQSYGYSTTTALLATTNNFLTPAATLSDPFPLGVNPITTPTGNSLGINAQLGSGIVFRGPNLKVPYSERWNLDIQQQITKNLMIDIGYIGNHQVHLSYTNAASSMPLLPYLSHTPTANPVVTANLNGKVNNPFYNVAGVASALSAQKTISKATLLQANPAYGSVTQQLVPGASALFHELIVRVQKRVSNGLTFNLNYEYSHSLMTGQLNAGGPLTYGESTSDYPHHVSVTGSYLLPFGHGQKFFHDSRLADLTLGGFTVNTIYIYLSGTSLQWNNVAFNDGNGGYTSYNPKLKINPRNFTQVFDQSLFLAGPTSSSLQPNAYNYRVFPQYYGRGDSTNNLDISVMKEFHIRERLKIQYRFEAFNALNHNQFAAPNLGPTSATFGTVTSPQANVPRVLQQGLRVSF